MEKYTPGPWSLGGTIAQRLKHGESDCPWCRDGQRLIRTYTASPPRRRLRGHKRTIQVDVHHQTEVIRAVVDHDSFALIETARLEWLKFEAGGPEAVAREFALWQVPDHVRLHLHHIPVIDEDGQRVDYLNIIQQAIGLGYIQ